MKRNSNISLEKAVGHFKTITHHKRLVFEKCCRVGLYVQGAMHDMSKYSWEEFSVGMRYYQGDRSPNNAEREDIGVSMSWLHHKGRNKHHFEHWVDYDPNGGKLILAGARIPRRYVAEMAMDRISACQTYHPDDYDNTMPLMYYEKSAGRLWFVHEQTKRELRHILYILATKGEDAMFDYVKHDYLHKK